MKEKLLILCYRRPYPAMSGGQIRMFQFIELLSEYFDVDVLYLEEKKDVPDLTGLTEKTGLALPFRVSGLRRLVQSAFVYLLEGKPLQIGYFYSSEMQKWINEHAKDYSRILCMHVRTVEYVLKAKKRGRLKEDCKLYLDGIDAISLNCLHNFQVTGGIKKLLNGMEYRRMRKYEKYAYENVDGSSLVSGRDRDYITQELKADCDPHLIYMYAVEYGQHAKTAKEPYSLFFMGKMNYQPNTDAMVHFVKTVYDRLKADYPELTLNIAGGFATEEILHLSSHKGVRICGYVENPSEYMQKAAIVIAPMISGSGLQTKIIQAMSLGCMVVTTPIGADGLVDIKGDELIISEDDEALYRDLKYYLAPGQAEKREAVGVKAREYIQNNYSYQIVKNQLEEAFCL